MFVDIVPVRSESRATFTRRPDALELALAGDRLACAVPFQAGKPAEPYLELMAQLGEQRTDTRVVDPV